MHPLYAPESSEQANVAGLIDDAKLNVAVVEDVVAGGLAVIVVSGALGGFGKAEGAPTSPARTRSETSFVKERRSGGRSTRREHDLPSFSGQ